MNFDETFQHSVTPWTVGDLKIALSHVPDDTPLIAWVAQAPGGDSVSEQVVVSAEFGEIDRGDGQGLVTDYSQLGISLEFPSGEYYRKD